MYGDLKKIVFVVNSQKNLIKISPVIDKLSRYYDIIEPIIIYTGRPLPRTESAFLFQQLSLPRPNIYLNVKPGSHPETMAGVMFETEKYFGDLAPDVVVIIGGSSAGLGASLTAARMGIRIAHIEAGLRCPGNSSATDISRKLIDSVSSLFFVTDGFAHANVFSEGALEDNIFFVGNVMIDAMQKFMPFARESKVIKKLGLTRKKYVVLSVHRKSNTRNYEILRSIISAAKQVSERIPVVFACHKRVKDEIEEWELGGEFGDGLSMYVVSRYPDFLALESNALFLMTDSGTMQVESSVLGIPCMTLRTNTEWIATVKEGTNKIVGPFPEKIVACADMVISEKCKAAGVPKYWDGHSAERIVEVLARSCHTEDMGTRKIRTLSNYE